MAEQPISTVVVTDCEVHQSDDGKHLVLVLRTREGDTLRLAMAAECAKRLRDQLSGPMFSAFLLDTWLDEREQKD